MNWLKTSLLCTAIVGLVGLSAVHAEDKPAPPNGELAPLQPPIHCEGQNCLPPAEDPVLDCKGQDCKPAPATDQTPGLEIEKVK